MKGYQAVDRDSWLGVFLAISVLPCSKYPVVFLDLVNYFIVTRDLEVLRG